MARDSYAWRLAGIEPKDNTFRDGGEALHRAFWRYIADAGVDLFHRRCNEGKDRFGNDLEEIKESTRRKGRHRSHTGLGSASAPPLVPAYGLSRAEDLLRGRGHVDHAEWHWVTDKVTGLHWGEVMHWHRIGAGTLPVRDVIGWSDKDIEELRDLGAEWWRFYQDGHRLKMAVEEMRLPNPKSGPIPPPKIAVTGRTDLENFTFGIGGSKERTERALAEGYHTGFSRKTPGGHTYGPKPTPPKPPTFGPSTAQVAVSDAPVVLSRLRAITGRDAVAERDLANIVGATHDAVVNVRPAYVGDAVTVHVSGPRYRATRSITMKNGLKTIDNQLFVAEQGERGSGLGREVFGRQVEQATEMGFERLVTYAARGGEYNGYYTWPRFGYDGPLPQSIKDQLPDEWRGASNVSDLMATEERRQWWKTHGISMPLEFDLREGSQSMIIWRAYLLEKETKA